MSENIMSILDHVAEIHREAAFEYNNRGVNHLLPDAHMRILSTSSVSFDPTGLVNDAELAVTQNRAQFKHPTSFIAEYVEL